MIEHAFINSNAQEVTKICKKMLVKDKTVTSSAKRDLIAEKQCHPRSAVFTLLRYNFLLTLRGERQKCLHEVSMGEKYLRP